HGLLLGGGEMLGHAGDIDTHVRGRSLSLEETQLPGANSRAARHSALPYHRWPVQSIGRSPLAPYSTPQRLPPCDTMGRRASAPWERQVGVAAFHNKRCAEADVWLP